MNKHANIPQYQSQHSYKNKNYKNRLPDILLFEIFVKTIIFQKLYTIFLKKSNKKY